MDKTFIPINGKEVPVLGVVQRFGRTWKEIEFYPRTIFHEVWKGKAMESCDDWLVLENEDISLHMNNNEGYMVLIEKGKSHFEEGKGFVTDECGHIFYTSF